jgi:hypothetical protein
MNLKFRGNYGKLRKCVSRTEFEGVWRDLPNGQKQYRTENGAILNWWESSGTITFQGRDPGKSFEKAFMAVAEAKERLAGRDGRQNGETVEQAGDVRRTIERAQADIAGLKWRALRKESPGLRSLIAERLNDVAKMINSLM